jgi:ribosome maturation factor RimP
LTIAKSGAADKNLEAAPTSVILKTKYPRWFGVAAKPEERVGLRPAFLFMWVSHKLWRADRLGVMQLLERIEGVIAPSLKAMEYEIVRLQLSGGKRPTLQIMAERIDGRLITLDECAEISRAVSALLDVEGPIEGAYNLEVSSPGIDRPLVRHKDFERFAGFEAKVELTRAIGGRKRFRGKLLGVKDDHVRVATDSGEVVLSLADIGRAKLVLTDELIAKMEERGHR